MYTWRTRIKGKFYFGCLSSSGARMADLFFVDNNRIYLTGSSENQEPLANIVRDDDGKRKLEFSESEGKITCEERFALIRWFNLTLLPKLEK